MESGFSIQTDEISAFEVELINLVKSKINQKQVSENQKLKQRFNSV